VASAPRYIGALPRALDTRVVRDGPLTSPASIGVVSALPLLWETNGDTADAALAQQIFEQLSAIMPVPEKRGARLYVSAAPLVTDARLAGPPVRS
jgi:hypothetical protein